MDQVRDCKNTDENWLEHIALKEAMSQLTDRERRILNLRFFEGRTQMEVSAEVGILSGPGLPAGEKRHQTAAQKHVNFSKNRWCSGTVSEHHLSYFILFSPAPAAWGGAAGLPHLKYPLPAYPPGMGGIRFCGPVFSHRPGPSSSPVPAR